MSTRTYADTVKVFNIAPVRLLDRLARSACILLNLPAVLIGRINETSELAIEGACWPDDLSDAPSSLPLEIFSRQTVGLESRSSAGLLSFELASDDLPASLTTCAVLPLRMNGRVMLMFGADDTVDLHRLTAFREIQESMIGAPDRNPSAGEGAVDPQMVWCDNSLESADHGFRYAHDAEGRFTELSESVHAVLGYGPDELIGRHYRELLHDRFSDFLAGELTRQALTSGKPAAPYLISARHRDGRAITLELRERPTPLEGMVSAVSGFARDVAWLRRSGEVGGSASVATPEGDFGGAGIGSALPIATPDRSDLHPEPGGEPCAPRGGRNRIARIADEITECAAMTERDHHATPLPVIEFTRAVPEIGVKEGDLLVCRPDLPGEVGIFSTIPIAELPHSLQMEISELSRCSCCVSEPRRAPVHRRPARGVPVSHLRLLS
jgi:PAS domain S-box-containing protein